MKTIEALFISDVHLGSKGCKASDLLETLKQYQPKYLFIVGDFIDGWLLKKRHYWSHEFTDVIRKILSYAKKGTQVIYITGNHDDFLRQYSPLDLGENILVVDEYVWNNYYITHGDLYDGIVSMKWLGILGSVGYEMAINIDHFMKRLGYKRSLSKYLKKKVKNAVKFITDFENQLAYQAKERNCSGVIAGHIHTPADKMIKDIHYLNCGDWIENNSYIVFNKGNFIVKYHN
jgi:UDP-2,3-diacylglucosamine pyrophosphatase LpxH